MSLNRVVYKSRQPAAGEVHQLLCQVLPANFPGYILHRPHAKVTPRALKMYAEGFENVRRVGYNSTQPRPQASLRYPSEVLGEFSQQALQVTPHQNSPGATGDEAEFYAVGSILHRTSPIIAQGPNVSLLRCRERGVTKGNSGNQFIPGTILDRKNQWSFSYPLLARLPLA